MTIFMGSPDRTSTFSATGLDLIKAAARKLQVLDDGDELSADTISNFLFGLNIMVKAYAMNGYQIWKIIEVAVPMLSGIKEYQIGPTATGTGAIVGPRPLRIMDTSYVRDSANLDTTLTPLSRQEYNQLGLKSTSSTVSQYFYDPQIPNGILKVYGTPSDSTHTVYLTAQVPVFDFNTTGDAADYPQECYQAVVYGLAEEMLEEYPPHDDRISNSIIKKAELYRNAIADWGQEETSVFFQPSPTIRHR